jgi:preprotein translocase subunit SecD
MTTVSDLLRDADPLRDEPGCSDAERNRVRAVVLATGADQPQPTAPMWRGRRAALLTALAMLAMLAIAAGSRLWSGGGVTVHAAAVRFEVRLAEIAFAPGLRPAPVVGSDRVIYLHPQTIVTNDEILRSVVVPNRDGAGFGVAVTLNAAGAENMRRATASHLNAPLALLVDGDVISAPTLRSPISESAIVSGDFTRAEAERIAEGMRVRP